MIETRYPGVYLTEIATGVHPIEGVSTSQTQYPGVFLEEIPTGVHPIDGVPTSTAAAASTADGLPAHTPEWTNHNEGDPGVTMLQLFAFLTESLLYRANLVPERDSTPVADAPPSDSERSTARIRKP